MACKGCKEKKPEIENNVTVEVENGIKKFSFPKWGLIVEGKNLIEAVQKAREILEKKQEKSE